MLNDINNIKDNKRPPFSQVYSKGILTIEMLQFFSVNAANTGETGQPKSAVIGNSHRTTFSTQAKNASTREYYLTHYGSEDLSERTRYIPKLLKEKLLELDPECDAEKLTESVLSPLGVLPKNEKKNQKNTASNTEETDDDKKAEEEWAEKTNVILDMTEGQIEALAELAIKCNEEKKKPSKKECNEAINSRKSFFQVLFGRMIANDPQANIDGCIQSAWPCSTHGTPMQVDPFTTIDTQRPDDNTGAAHMDIHMFTQGTMYFSFNINLIEAWMNTDKNDRKYLAENIVRFVKAYMLSNPSGKKAQMLTGSQPYFIDASFGNTQMNNFDAFSKELKPEGTDYMQPSLDALVNKIHSNDRRFHFTEKSFINYNMDFSIKEDIGESIEDIDLFLEAIKNYVQEIFDELDNTDRS